MCRVGADPHSDARRLNGKLVLIAPDCESVGKQGEMYTFRFTRSQRHPFKSLQNSDGLRRARPLKTDVELDNFFSCSLSCVRD